MANSKDSGPGREYASVDTAPSADGYWTNPVSMHPKGAGTRMFFSMRDGGDSSAWDATIHVQFKCVGDPDWTDYESYTNSDTPRQLIEGQARGVQWRVGIKSGNYTAGKVIFGLDWQSTM